MQMIRRAGASRDANGEDSVPVAEDEKLLSPWEVAGRFRVKPDTDSNWDGAGVLKAACRTPGGYRRWRGADVIRPLKGPEGWPGGNRRRHDVSTGDIVRLWDAEGMTWQAIGQKPRMTRSGVKRRYERNQARSHTVGKLREPEGVNPDAG